MSPNTIRGYYCTNINIFGGTPRITEDVLPSDSPIYQYNTTPKVLNCYSYIDSVTDPFTYGIQDSKEISSNVLNPENLLNDYLPPQATINVGMNTPMNLAPYGVTSSIQTALGFVLPSMPIPLDAVLKQIDNKIKDTPLGKTGKVKLASEFFNRISLNIRQDAYGMAEKIGAGLTNLAGNLVSSVVGGNKSHPNGMDTIVDAFRNHEITVPKSVIGRAANLISSLGGVNLKLDPITEMIEWTAYVEKVEEEDTSLYEGGDIKDHKRNFWNKLTGLGRASKTNDPSEILLAYTSSGQRQFISNSLKINEYRPYYQIAGFSNDGRIIQKYQKKLRKLDERIKNDTTKIADYQKQYDKLKAESEKIDSYTSETPEIRRLINGRFAKSNTKVSDAKAYLKQSKVGDIVKLNKKIEALTIDKEQCRRESNSLKTLDPYPWYPIYDDGTFNGDKSNSKLKSLMALSEDYEMDLGVLLQPLDLKDFADSSVDGTKIIYTHPVDDVDNVSRYRKQPNYGTASEEPSPEITYNVYEKVSDLLKHGVKPSSPEEFDLRGLNVYSLDKPGDSITTIGYNVYPRLEKSTSNILYEPGLGREDIYDGQSLFSVLESNGFVKISPLWGGDGCDDPAQSVSKTNLKSKRYKIEEGGNKDAVEDYKDRVIIHRYMFSIENLAWKGFQQQLPWQERGPNGGRIMWFPPYDLTISDTTSVSLGSENLIGRNEPIYTYNHSERVGVLSFKMIMDYPGYHNPDKTTCVTETKTQQKQQDVTDTMTVLPLNAPIAEAPEWDILPDTHLYIFLDTSVSMVT
jgi:hypothetical protein